MGGIEVRESLAQDVFSVILEGQLTQCGREHSQALVVDEAARGQAQFLMSKRKGVM